MIRRLLVLAVLWNAGKTAAQIGYAWGHTDGYRDAAADGRSWNRFLDASAAAFAAGPTPRKES